MKNFLKILSLMTLCACLSVSCNDEEHTLEFKTCTVELSFTGDMDKLSPWTRFSFYSEISDLYLLEGNTKDRLKENSYQSVKDDLYKDQFIFEQRWCSSLSKKPDIHFACTFLKIKKNPSTPDTLRIRVKQYIDDKLLLDSTHEMKSFTTTDSISSKDYIYHLTL